jgi:hypothetical protein
VTRTTEPEMLLERAGTERTGDDGVGTVVKSGCVMVVITGGESSSVVADGIYP